MSEWSAGYMADIDYTYGYYTELNPLRARLAFMNAGLQAPVMEHACELGFGQGVTVNLHAAASTTRWAGTDFNPAHASYAQELAKHAGQGAQLQEEAFDVFCQRTDLPDFDFIGMHGIWSWVSDENRSVLVDFLARKLKPGGVLYLSYNTQPGWAAMAPMRDLLAEHAKVMSAPSTGVIQRVDDALDFAQRLLATDPVYGLLNPQIKDRVTRLQGQERHYLAHEYFNDHWHPMGFSNVARLLAPAKLQWACSAHLMDSLEAINLTAPQRELLASISDRTFRESVRDFCINQQFRKDYWVKGARELSALEQATQWRQQRFVLVVPPAQVSLKVTGRQAEITYSADIYNPVLTLMADHQVHTGAQLEQAMLASGIDFPTLRQVVWVLCAVGAVQPAQDEASRAKAQASAELLNLKLLEKSYGKNPVQSLASPVTGGGLAVTPFEQQFLLARRQGMAQPAEWGAYAWHILQAQGSYLAVDGQPLVNPEDSLVALQGQAQHFAEQRLPLLLSLGLA